MTSSVSLRLYPTARSVVLMAAGAPAALTIGVVWPRLWPLGFGWMLFVLLLLALDAALVPASRRIVARLAPPRSAYVGSTIRIQLTLATGVAVQALLDVDHRLSSVGEPRRLLRPDGGSAGTILSFAAIRRGTTRLSALWLRWKGPLGLVWKQRRQPLDDSILITPDLRPVREQSQLFVRQAQAGETVRRDVGTGAEFRSLLPFAEGMDRRAIDWKQSARHATLLAKDWQIERNNQIVLAIDAGRAMAEPLGGVPRIDRAVSAALLAAYVALKLDDRVGLFAYAEQPVAASAIASGIGAFPVIQRLAAGIDYGTRETNHTLGLTQLAQRLDRRTLIIVFTEFTDPTSAELMLRACALLLKRHLLLFLVYRDDELDGLAAAEPITPEDVTRAVAAQALLRERAIVAARLRRMGVHVVEASHEKAGTALVDVYLLLKRQGLL